MKLLQTAGTQEGARVGLGATETLVEEHRVFAAAFFKDVAAVRHGHILVENAFLHEEFEGILVKYFRPKIAVIACAVAAVEDMIEIGGTVTWNDLVNQTGL